MVMQRLLIELLYDLYIKTKRVLEGVWSASIKKKNLNVKIFPF